MYVCSHPVWDTANAGTVEIQGPHRRPATTPTHGLLGWCRACEHCRFHNESSPSNTDKPQMADKENMWISKQEWEEQGARALEKLGAR
jgi:hypothetical protein